MKYPGQMEVTFTPSNWSSMVIDLTKPQMACLDAQYRGLRIEAFIPAIEETRHTTPFLSLPRRARMASRVSLIGWFTLMSIHA